MNKILNISKIVIGVVLFFTTIGFVHVESKKACCTSIHIEIPDSLDYGFVNSSIIQKEIERKFRVTGRNLDSIRTDKIETELAKYPAVKDVQVYRSITDGLIYHSGKLKIKVNQREPLFRVMGKYGNFYVDKDGEMMPLSANYTARVPIIQGYVKKEFAQKELFEFIKYLKSNDFWNAQISQIQVSGQKELILIPRVGDHIIEFGKIENYQRKLNNLRSLYKNYSKQGNWNEFSRINLKYENQIVCTK